MKSFCRDRPIRVGLIRKWGEKGRFKTHFFEAVWETHDLKDHQRSYWIDCIPSLIYANGALANWIVNANIGHYVQFRCLDGVFVYFDQEIHRVPCSKSEIFTSSVLSLSEKRILTRFLTNILSNSSDIGIILGDSPLVDYLKQEKFTERLMLFLLCGVLFEKDALDSIISLKEAISRIRNTLNSLNIYGPSAFLYPIYGTGELPQAFSRYQFINNWNMHVRMIFILVCSICSLDIRR